MMEKSSGDRLIGIAPYIARSGVLDPLQTVRDALEGNRRSGQSQQNKLFVCNFRNYRRQNNILKQISETIDE
jgi:hypothetical protein